MFAAPLPLLLKPWVVNTTTACLWAAVVAGLTGWGLELSRPPEQTLAAVSSVNEKPQEQGLPLALALGHRALSVDQKEAQPQRALSQASAFKLLGVIASASGQGSALIAIDGKPPQAYRVGQSVQERFQLVFLTARQATLKSADAEFQLELPAAQKPSP